MATICLYGLVSVLESVLVNFQLCTGIYKTWTLDSGLDSGLDHGLTTIQALIN